jgi:hypothetical protein
MDGKRWDSDKRGRGVANGGWIAPSVQRLLHALAEPDWVAEQPEDHLLPGLRSVIDAPGSAWTLVETSFREGVFEVVLEWLRREPSLRLLRADAHTLIGSIAEGTTFVRQVIAGDAVEYQAATGLLDGDTPFRGHGHVLRLRVIGPAVRQVVPAEASRSP